MTIKILGGFARGFSLISPKGFSTRPTSVMLKRRLFDSIQDFSGYIFIDICAGSGSIGLEALSRGAESVTFIENNGRSFQNLKNNCHEFRQRYNLGEKIDLVKKDFASWLKSYEFNPDRNYFLFFDPPYEKLELYQQFIHLISEKVVKGQLVIEACSQKTMPIEDFQVKFREPQKVFKQGTNYFLIYDL